MIGFEEDEIYEDVWKGFYTRPGVYNPDKISAQATVNEIQGHYEYHYSTKERKEIKRKFKEQNEIL